jgi:hypothetical protein
MSQLGYVFLAVGILLLLLIVFFVTFVLYRKAPAPKGCEKLPSAENCAKCALGEGCAMNLYGQKEDPKK